MKQTSRWIIALSLVAGLVIAYGCKGQDQKSGIVTLKVGSVKVQRPGLQPADLQIKDRIVGNDIIVTGPASFAVVQFSDNCVVQVQENTRFKILSAEKNDRDLYVQEGQVLTKLMRTGDNSATVRTPTAIAAVRGTQFSVNYRQGGTQVAVSEGKVAVKAASTDETGKALTQSKEETITAAGNTAEVTAAPQKTAGEEAKLVVNVRAITENEKQTLKKIETVPVIQDAGKKTGEELEAAVKKGIGYYPNDLQEKIKQLMAQETRTLDDIRGVFNRIDEVTLYSGRVIQGAILSRGAEYKILTPEGTVTVPEEEIKSAGELK
jgi:hypothetical protein